MKTSSLRSLLCILLSLFFAMGAGSMAYGTDAISFNPVPVSIKASAGGGGVPVGTIVAWPVATNPSDADSWLECNGQPTSGYPELAAVVGANVPDLQGKFLRGLGGNSAALGVAQGDAIRNITGELYSNGSVNVNFLTDGDLTELEQRGALYYSRQRTSYGIANNILTNYVSGFAFDASRIVPTANENRPVNMAVRYLIRARP